MSSRLAVLALFAALILGACTGRPPTPTDYGNTTQKNFMAGCLNTAEGISKPSVYCQCAYDAIVKQIPFDDFKDLNSELSDDPAALTGKMRTIRDDCLAESKG